MDLQDPPTYKIIPFPAKPLIKPNTRRNVSSPFVLTSEGATWIYETLGGNYENVSTAAKRHIVEATKLDPKQIASHIQYKQTSIAGKQAIQRLNALAASTSASASATISNSQQLPPLSSTPPTIAPTTSQPVTPATSTAPMDETQLDPVVLQRVKRKTKILYPEFSDEAVLALEGLYLVDPRPEEEEYEAYALELGLVEARVRRWFRWRRGMDGKRSPDATGSRSPSAVKREELHDMANLRRLSLDMASEAALRGEGGIQTHPTTTPLKRSSSPSGLPPSQQLPTPSATTSPDPPPHDPGSQSNSISEGQSQPIQTAIAIDQSGQHSTHRLIPGAFPHSRESSATSGSRMGGTSSPEIALRMLPPANPREDAPPVAGPSRLPMAPIWTGNTGPHRTIKAARPRSLPYPPRDSMTSPVMFSPTSPLFSRRSPNSGASSRSASSVRMSPTHNFGPAEMLRAALAGASQDIIQRRSRAPSIAPAVSGGDTVKDEELGQIETNAEQIMARLSFLRPASAAGPARYD